MLTPGVFRLHFEDGLTFGPYAAKGTEAQRANWQRAHAGVSLTEPQRALVASFTRQINVLVSSGLWCGDCVQQCPMLDRIAAANPARVHLRFVDRDEHKELSEPLMICGGLRVPTVVFLNEDFEFVSVLGDRTLSRYRALAAQAFGASCPLPGVALSPDVSAGTLQDWVNEFERVHLLLRMSPKLRERHGD